MDRSLALIFLLAVTALATPHAQAKGTDGICGDAPERWICGMVPPDDEFSRAQEKRRNDFEKLRHQVMMNGFESAHASCPGFHMVPIRFGHDPVLDSPENRYLAAFEEEASEDRRFCVTRHMFDAVMSAVHARNPSITAQSIDDFFEKTKNELIQIVQTKSAFTVEQKTQIEREIRKVVLVNANSYASVAAKTGSSNPYAFGCQQTLSPTAYMTFGFSSFKKVQIKAKAGAKPFWDQIPLAPGDHNYLQGCPGLFFELLNTTPGADPYQNWVRLLGHELSHTFHAYLNPETYLERTPYYDPATQMFPQSMRLEKHFWENYKPVLSCLEENYATGTDIRDLLKPSVPDDDWREKYRPLIGRPADLIEMHMVEYSPEFWGMTLLGREVAGYAPADRLAAAYNGIKLLCPKLDVNWQWNDDVDGTHPSRAFRIRMAMRNPELRHALGCPAETPGGKPWCEL